MIKRFLVRECKEDHDYKMNYYRDEHDNIVLFKNHKKAQKVLTEELNNEGFIEAVNMEQKYVLTNAMNENEKFCLIFNMYEILQEINRDRSAEWTDYDQADFIEGLKEWTSYELVGKLEKV